MEVCKQLTYTRADEYAYLASCHGPTLLQDGWTAFARCFGGDHISPDMRVKANEEPVVRLLKSLALLFKAGVLPPQTLTIRSDMISWIRRTLRDRAVVDLARLPALNDPRRSKFPGPDQANEMAHDRLARR